MASPRHSGSALRCWKWAQPVERSVRVSRQYIQEKVSRNDLSACGYPQAGATAPRMLRSSLGVVREESLLIVHEDAAPRPDEVASRTVPTSVRYRAIFLIPASQETRATVLSRYGLGIASGMNSCCPLTLKSAMIFCPWGPTMKSISFFARSPLTCGCLAGFTAMIP
jgi:hypothetical protein